MTAPWRTFTIGGAVHRVRMSREYEGQNGSVWRDYMSMGGRVVCIRAKAPGGKRPASEKVTARRAAHMLAGSS